MPITKVTTTVAGESYIGGLTVKQYTLRVPIVIPSMRHLAATHRSSSSNMRTIYFAEPHGINAGERVWPGGFGTSWYDAEASYMALRVQAVGTDWIQYAKSGVMPENKTAVTQGGIVVQGFSALRLGFRFRVTAQTDFTASSNLMVYGFSTGPHPVSSDLCGGFTGHATPGVAATYNAGTGRLSLATGYYRLTKNGSTWQSSFSQTGTSVSATRENPEARVIDVIAQPANAYLQGTRGVCQAAGITREQFVSALRFPEAMDNAAKTLGALAFSSLYYATDQQLGMTAFKYSPTPSLYLEIGSMDPTCGLEIFDIGYCFW